MHQAHVSNLRFIFVFRHKQDTPCSSKILRQKPRPKTERKNDLTKNSYWKPSRREFVTIQLTIMILAQRCMRPFSFPLLVVSITWKSKKNPTRSQALQLQPQWITVRFEYLKNVLFGLSRTFAAQWESQQSENVSQTALSSKTNVMRCDSDRTFTLRWCTELPVGIGWRQTQVTWMIDWTSFVLSSPTNKCIRLLKCCSTSFVFKQGWEWGGLLNSKSHVENSDCQDFRIYHPNRTSIKFDVHFWICRWWGEGCQTPQNFAPSAHYLYLRHLHHCVTHFLWQSSAVRDT